MDEIVQNRRNTKAARLLLTRLLKKQGMAPKRVITDKLRSYGAAKRQIMPDVEHRSHKSLLNNRAENSLLPSHLKDRTGIDRRHFHDWCAFRRYCCSNLTIVPPPVA
jgi:putative transposase